MRNPFAIIFGILAGYVVAAIFTGIGYAAGNDALKVIDFTKFQNIEWLPRFTFIEAFTSFKDISDAGTFFGYVGSIAVAYVPVAFVVFAEHIADHKNLSSIIEHDLLEDPGLSRTLLGDGVGSMVGAFFGAVISIVLALRIATIRNKVTATQLVLAGIAVSALFGAITNYMIYHTKTGSDKVKTATYWLMGSLNGASWDKLKYASIAFVVCLIMILALTRNLDVLLLGDDVAVTVGVDTDKLKLIIIAVATLLTGVIVSVSGTIGFVGLTIPHITRSIVGTKHKRLIPASVLVGGTFLVVADIISRVIVAPEELPIGVVSAFFGAPFFLYLIRRSNGKFGG